MKGTAASEIERLVADAQAAIALDTVERLHEIPTVGDIVVATGDPRTAEKAASLGAHAEFDEPGREFHFGRRLADLVSRYRASTALYIGGGSGALMQPEDWRELLHRVMTEPGGVICNNFYSCDLAAWSPAQALERISPPELDNDLAFRLGGQAGLRVSVLPKTAATLFDVDTPTDLQIVSLHPQVGARLRSWLETAKLDTGRAESIRARMADPHANLLISGRVSASTMLFLERSTPCQWRVFSEERGMRASGRMDRGEVHSLLGHYLDAVGPSRFFATLATLADGILMDSRVLFAHAGRRPSAPDRFCSDLMIPERIQDPFVREFTMHARELRTLLLGGHSLVSGGPYVLAGPLTQ